jgi:hypothetical protein
MKRRNLLAAVRERMRRQTAAHDADERAARPSEPAIASEPTAPRPRADLEQLEAEARYHRERYELYRARVRSGSSRPTSPVRLRELERTATAAAERLAHARR